MFNNKYTFPLLDEDIEFLPIVSMEEVTEEESDKRNYTEPLPILPLRNTVLFPGVVVPITVGREKSVKAVKEAYKTDKYVGVLTQTDPNIEEPEANDLHETGTVARIVKMLKMPDGSTTVIIQGKDRFTVKEFITFDPMISANISVIEEKELAEEDNEFEALISSMKDIAQQIVNLSPNIPDEASIILKNIDSPEFLIHFISANLNISIKEKQQLLQLNDVKKRAEIVLQMLNKEVQLLELKNQIQSKVRTDIEKQQRDYFLHQQMKTIQEELGDNSGTKEADELKARADQKQLPVEARKVFDKELKKLRRTNPMVADYSITLNYLELILELPWNEYTEDNFDLKLAKKILDKDHFGLDKVKDRILEYLAVLKLKGDMKSPILCFVGPPGVGKTSLGRSIARALNRQYIRMSLGGLRDEAEIRGHRKTYIGAMPGRIIQSLRRAKASNPVFILDEIDKVGSDFRGDPSSALLEVLDPEQNSTFHDNYLDVDYDLSKTMFVATANSLHNIHPALQDRMEIIRLSGYSLEEKVEIAKRYIIPKQRKEHGLKAKQIKLTPKVLEKIISEHTREAGVRTLERKIAAVMRWVAKSVAMEEAYNPRLKLTDIDRILGLKNFDRSVYKNDSPAGVAVGLAWTQTGGDILFIETSLSKGKGKMTITGNLGDVMKESATTALSFIKANAESLSISPDIFEQQNIHLHVPEGAIPKDGPSAGITMLTALVSAFTQKKVKPYLAMTGEITLRGKVLPVGGIKEKILAAKRAGIQEIILCHSNEKDVNEINPNYIKNLQFHYLKNMSEVLKLALVNS